MGARDQGGTAQLDRPLPTGTVTFVFCDIEGSTRLLRRLGERYGSMLTEHRALLRDAFEASGGHLVHVEGDSGLFTFPDAAGAVAGALEAQRALARHTWPADGELRVRIGIHTGEAVVVSGDYVGLAVHQAARICTAGHGGQILISQATRELVGTKLPPGSSLVDLGRYRLKDLEEPERINQLVHPDLPAVTEPLRVADFLPNNLPAPLSSFVGRDTELREVRALGSETRLLTLRGPGGSGKTRIALEVARGELETYPGGVWFVDLAVLSSPNLVEQRVAAVLGVQEGRRGLIDALADRLRRADTLLVLDNCEHVLDACARLAAQLLSACPPLRILTTSREALGVPGEVTWVVPPMTLPADGADPSTMLDCDAVRLFMDRARQVRTDLAQSDENVMAVTQICRRLDGNPLAIELAAARTRVLTPAQIADRLDDRLRLLTGIDRTAGERHQTLRATVDWSYELLSEREREMFGRLGIFHGDWILEAVEGVCAFGEIDRGDVLELLTALVDKSLVLSNTSGAETTYRMLETVRLYALDRLAETFELDETARRYREWYLRFAELTASELSGRDQAARYDVLEAEYGNLRGVLSSALEAGDGDTAIRLAVALGEFWSARGLIGEGRLWLWATLEAVRSPSAARAKALARAATLTETQGDYAAARVLYAESLGLAETLGDEALVGNIESHLVSVEIMEGHYDAALERNRRALEIAEASGDRAAIARGLHNQGTIEFMRGDRAGSRQRFERALEIRREVDHSRGIAETLNNLAIVARVEGEPQRALELTVEALSIVRALGHRPLVATFSGNLGIVLQRAGRLSDAKALFEESLTIRRELGDRDGVAIVGNSLGNAAYLQGNFDAARAAHTESLALRREIGDPRGIAETLANLAAVLRATDDLEGAAACQTESLGLRRELGDRSGIAGSLLALAEIAMARDDNDTAHALLREALGEAIAASDRGRQASILEDLAQLSAPHDPERAAVLLGAADTVPPEARYPVPVWVSEDRTRSDVRAALGEDGFEQALARGAATEIGDLVGTD